MKKLFFVVTAGFALFSMFFGAGNLVLPLALGANEEYRSWAAIIGFILTAVAVPLIGFMTVILFDGDYRAFFARFGAWGGFLLSATLLAVLGPFGGIARCAALTNASLQHVVPSLSPWLGTFLFSFAVFFMAVKPSSVVAFIGKRLTPLLLGSAALLLGYGFFMAPAEPFLLRSEVNSGVKGLLEGYYTLDLIAALFFSSFIYSHIRESKIADSTSIWFVCLQIALVSALLLALVYAGFFMLAALYGGELATCPKELLLSHIAAHLFGPLASFVVALLVLLACLTTSVALAAIAAEFVQKDIFKDRLSYQKALFFIMAISWVVAAQEFTGVESLLGPVVQWVYPILSLLCLYSIAYRAISRWETAVSVVNFQSNRVS